MSSGETRNEKKKDKEKNTRYSRQRGETIKNTDAQIKTEAERGGSRHLESKMLQLQSRWGKQESRAGKRQRPRSSGVRSRPFPSCAFCLSTTSAGEYTRVLTLIFPISAAVTEPHYWYGVLTPTSWPQLLPGLASHSPPPPHRSHSRLAYQLGMSQAVMGFPLHMLM